MDSSSCLLFAIVLHVGLHQCIGRQGRQQTEFSREGGRRHDGGQLACIGTGFRRMTSTTPDQFKTGRLGRQSGSASHGTHFNTGHGARDPQIARFRFFQQGNALGTFHVLRGVLSGGQKHGRDNIRSVGIKSPQRPGHGGSDQVLVQIGMHHGGHGRFECGAYHLGRDDGFHHDGLAPPL
eukprot:scaffold14974_cov195-Amphora_coffeaeformis.AAC.37